MIGRYQLQHIQQQPQARERQRPRSPIESVSSIPVVSSVDYTTANDTANTGTDNDNDETDHDDNGSNSDSDNGDSSNDEDEDRQHRRSSLSSPKPESPPSSPRSSKNRNKKKLKKDDEKNEKKKDGTATSRDAAGNGGRAHSPIYENPRQQATNNNNNTGKGNGKIRAARNPTTTTLSSPKRAQVSVNLGYSNSNGNGGNGGGTTTAVTSLASLSSSQQQQQQQLLPPNPLSGPMTHMSSTVSTSPPLPGFERLPHPQRECDYDKSPTQLYRLIQNKDWNACLELLTIDPDDDVDLQACTWVVRKEKNSRLRWRLLPLHAAIIFQAPPAVVEGLLQVYPHAAACKDDQGMLPLHLALRNKPIHWESVEEIVTTNPAAVFVRDRKGRTPLQCANGGGGSKAPHRLRGGNASVASSVTGNNSLYRREAQYQQEQQHQKQSSSNNNGADTSLHNNQAALSVLKLFAQIVAVRERQQAAAQQSPGWQDAEVRSTASSQSGSQAAAAAAAALQQLSQQHARKLSELQVEVEQQRVSFEREKAELRQQLAVSTSRESSLQHRLVQLQATARSQQEQLQSMIERDTGGEGSLNVQAARQEALLWKNRYMQLRGAATLTSDVAAQLERLQVQQAAQFEHSQQLLTHCQVQLQQQSEAIEAADNDDDSNSFIALLESASSSERRVLDSRSSDSSGNLGLGGRRTRSSSPRRRHSSPNGRRRSSSSSPCRSSKRNGGGGPNASSNCSTGSESQIPVEIDHEHGEDDRSASVVYVRKPKLAPKDRYGGHHKYKRQVSSSVANAVTLSGTQVLTAPPASGAIIVSGTSPTATRDDNNDRSSQPRRLLSFTSATSEHREGSPQRRAPPPSPMDRIALSRSHEIE